MAQKFEGMSRKNLIPIIIGVTGHRDLRDEDREKLEEQVRLIFTELKKDYPHTPLVLLSPLAEGADQLVARVALSFGLRLIVPLPMEKEEYKKDFESSESQVEFEELLAKASPGFVLPLVKGNTTQNIQEYGENRNKQYTQVGAYIVRHSQILIALWDGMTSNLTGGTVQIINFKRGGIPEPYGKRVNPLDPVDAGPVYQIVTRRVGNQEPVGELFAIIKLFPFGWDDNVKEAEKAYKQILYRIEKFNCDFCRNGPKLADEITINKDRIMPEEKVKALPPASKIILGHYAIADSVAQYFQRMTHLTFKGLFLIAVLAVLCFELYAHFPGEERQVFFLALYSLLFGIAFCLYVIAKRWEWQQKYLGYRALAEGLRVQFFWSISGLEKENVSDYYLRKQKSELDWIRIAISSWNIGSDQRNIIEKKMGLEESRFNYQLVFKHWIIDQCNFHNGSTIRDHWKFDSHERLVFGVF